LNPKSQQVSGCRPRTETTLPPKSANMKCSASKFVSHLLNDYQKQNQLSLCKDLQVQYQEARNFLYSPFWPHCPRIQKSHEMDEDLRTWQRFKLNHRWYWTTSWNGRSRDHFRSGTGTKPCVHTLKGTTLTGIILTCH